MPALRSSAPAARRRAGGGAGAPRCARARSGDVHGRSVRALSCVCDPDVPGAAAVVRSAGDVSAQPCSTAPCAAAAAAASPAPPAAPPPPLPPPPLLLRAGDLFDGSLLLQDTGAEMWEVDKPGRKMMVVWGTDVDEFDLETQVRCRGSAVQGMAACARCLRACVHCSLPDAVRGCAKAPACLRATRVAAGCWLPGCAGAAPHRQHPRHARRGDGGLPAGGGGAVPPVHAAGGRPARHARGAGGAVTALCIGSVHCGRDAAGFGRCRLLPDRSVDSCRRCMRALQVVGVYGDLDLGVSLTHEDAFRLVVALRRT